MKPQIPPPTRSIPSAVLIVAFACAVVASMLLAHALGRDAITALILGGALGGVVGGIWKQIMRPDRGHY